SPSRRTRSRPSISANSTSRSSVSRATRSSSSSGMPARSAASAATRYRAPLSSSRQPSRAAIARATVPLPAPLGPSIVRIGTPGSAGTWSPPGDGQPAGGGHVEEAREGRRDRRRIADLDRSVAQKTRDRERHRDPMVTVAVDLAAVKPPALDDEACLPLLDLRPERGEAARHHGQPIALLVAQLLGAADDRSPPRTRGGDEQDRKLVDRKRHELRRNVDAGQL